MSNTLSLRLLGDPKNPKVCVRVLKFTGGCETTGSCETTGVTYTTGYTIAWSEEFEIDAISIYLDITGKHFGDISRPKFSYAAD